MLSTNGNMLVKITKLKPHGGPVQVTQVYSLLQKKVPRYTVTSQSAVHDQDVAPAFERGMFAFTDSNPRY